MDYLQSTVTSGMWP
jgi:hypothetical protein